MLKRIKAVPGLILIIVLLLSNVLSFAEQPVTAAAGDEEPDLPPIVLPEKGNPKLDSRLNKMVAGKTARTAPGFAREDSAVSANEKVRVIIEGVPGQLQAAAEAAGNAGGKLEASYKNLLQVEVPVTALTGLANAPAIRFVRMPWEPLMDEAIVSEGVPLINADDWQTSGYDGTGVKIAVLDGGFSGYTSLLGTELPASVIAQSFNAAYGINGTSSHGTAVAEIVYDIAPGAQLYLVNFGTVVELGNAVDWLIDQEVDIISASWGYPGLGPGDGTGLVNDIVADARAAGILWTNAAGNSAQRHWQGDFNDTDSDNWTNFSGSDEGNTFSVFNGDTITAVLNWDDDWGASANDYDLFLMNKDGIPVYWTYNPQDGDHDPYEALSYTANYTGNYSLAIYKYSATQTVNFHLYSYNHTLQYQVASGSITVPADSPNALTVGAVNYGTPTTLEPFSSRGPTTDNRTKPDLVAPDGVSTVSYPTPFYGTSAAAPHAAGAAALVKQRYPAYTPAQIQDFMEGRAVEIGGDGKDNLFGSGRLYLGSVPELIPPAVTTNAAGNITGDAATLNGNLTELGEYGSAEVYFEWGTNSDNLTQETSPQAMNSTGAFSVNLSGLSFGTTYYFEAKAAVDDVTISGEEISFTTVVLSSIDIAPSDPAIALGRTQQFNATGTYSDNSTADISDNVTWISSNTTVATIDSAGLAQSLLEGQTVITATSGNVSDNTTFTVGPKALDAVDVAPQDPAIALGRTRQFSATGTYSDNSTASITDNVTWESSDTGVATIDAAGLALSLAEGQAVITATSGNLSDNTTLTVGPKALDMINVTPVTPSIDAGGTQQFSATGTYSDNSTDDLTSSVTWTSDNTTVARINAAGLARSYAEGDTLITATSGNVSDNTTLTVGPPLLESITVTPLDPAIVMVSGSPPTLQFTATAGYSNGAATIVTGTANWTSDNTSVATIGAATGLVTVAAEGNTTISALYNGISGNTTLTVLPDTVAPVVMLDSPTGGQAFSDNTTTVTGNVDDINATSSVIVNSGAPIALTLDGNGNFSQSVTLNTGSNNILVVAVDGSGNTGTSGTITVVVDPDKPTVSITQPALGTVTSNSSLAVSGSVSGNVTAVNLVINGVSQSVSVLSGSFSTNVTLSEGVNTISANAYTPGHDGDSSYRGTSGVRPVTLDTTPPVVTIYTPASGKVVNTPGYTVSGSVDDPAVSTANLTLNGISQAIPVVGGSFSQNITLAFGNNTIAVTATDAPGNVSTADTATIILDNIKPVVTITSPSNGLVTGTASQVISGTIDDPTIASADLYLNDVSQTIPVSSGNFSTTVTLEAGTNTIEVRAADGAIPANTGTSGVINVTLDNTAPTLIIGLDDPTDSITITVTSNEALAAAPATSVNSTAVSMTWTGVNQWRGVYGSAGSPVASGAYVVTVNGTDKAGNTASRTATFVKQVVTISGNATVTVSTDTATLQISATANVTDASVSVTSSTQNPSGNTGNPAGAEKSAGVFLEIVVSPELRDNLEQIYIMVDYNPDNLPGDTDETTLKLYLWDIASGTWQVVPDSDVNTTEHYIYGTITHLSKYGGFGTAVVPPSPAPPSGGGGGGGGGGGASSGLTSFYYSVENDGVFISNVTAKSADNVCTLQITTGTKGLNRFGQVFYIITMLEVEQPPEPPEGSNIIGKVYDISPDGAIFEPAITLTVSYNPELLPEMIDEKELYIAYWDGSQWLALESTVDREADTISAQISHFTQFAVIGKPPTPAPTPAPTLRLKPTPVPASFTISGLSVTPDEAKPGEQVTVSVLVTNTGGSRGTHAVILKINAIEQDRKEVTLEAGENETVAFSLVKSGTGVFTVDVNGEIGQFKVVTHSEPPEASPASVPETEPPIQTTNWWLIGGVMAGSMVTAGLLGYLFSRRKRDAL